MPDDDVDTTLVSPVKEFRVAASIQLRLDERHPNWRQHMDQLRAKLPRSRWSQGPNDWILIEGRCAPEVAELLDAWQADIPDHARRLLKGYAAMEMRTRDFAASRVS